MQGQKKILYSASLTKDLGNDGVVELRDRYENKKLRFILLDEEPGDRTLEQPGRIIQKYNRGYMISTSRWGRAHYYAPYKRLGNMVIGTYWFNIANVWAGALILYILLYFNIFQKITNSLGSMRFSKSES